MDTFNNRLKEAMDYRHMTQAELANRTGLSKPRINQYVKGIYEAKQDALIRIAEALHVNVTWLMGYDVDMLECHTAPVSDLTNVSLPAARAVPILGTICAGNGIFCEDNYEGFFYVDRSIRADLCLIVKGDSMIEADIFDGDKAFITQDCIFEEGRIYAVRINSDNEAVLKRVFRQGDNVILSACNPEYSPMIEKASNVSIIGECIGVYHAVDNRR